MDTSKKILIVSFYFYPEIGAAPSRITNLAKGLHGRGYHVDVLTCLPNYPKGKIFEEYRSFYRLHEMIDHINVYRYWTYASISKSPIKRIWGMTSFAVCLWQFAFKRKQIRQYDYIIIQTPPLIVSFSSVLLFKILYKKKIILNISDLWPTSAVELNVIKEGSKMHKILLKIESFIYRKSDRVMGQSGEIIQHVKTICKDKDCFLYRNLQLYKQKGSVRNKNRKLKIVYAGLLGVAQDIFSIIKNIDFWDLDVELHLYGGGNQKEMIEKYISSKQTNIFYHGYIPKEQIETELSKYDVSIVPLVVHIKGAVPSKIFDLLPLGIPVLFCGGGEGAEIIEKHDLGLTSLPGDFSRLKENIVEFKNMSDENYEMISKNCIETAKSEFDFTHQLDKFISYIEK